MMAVEHPQEGSELRTLVELSTLINSSLDIQTVLDNAMECVQMSMNAEASAIFELDEAKRELSFRIVLGDAADKAKEVRLRIGEGVAGWVAQTGTPVIVQDTHSDSRFSPLVDVTTGFETRSILCVPMVYKGELTGVIEVLNKKGKGVFDANDQEVLTVLANQIAIAIENARLYTRLSERFSLATEELKSAQEKLIRSERLAALGRLSQGVAHEVRNPVMVIGGFAHRLEKEFPDNVAIRKMAEIILAETERLERMVVAIETLSKLRQPVPQATELPKVVEAALRSVSGHLTSQGIQVIGSYSHERQAIEADEELLELAIRNVLMNAIEAMPDGGTLELSLASHPDGMLLSIKDSGVGIHPGDLANIFDPFFTSKAQGSGLGLSTVHRIISDHSGEINLSSTPGRGTEVQIRLPHHR
jgi:two-component system sensor histidine kinase HydH